MTHEPNKQAGLSYAPEDHNPGRVLAVDDSPISLEILSNLLEEDGHEVLRATCGAEALHIVGGTSVDVVVCDLHMPDMDGFDMLAQLRSAQAELPVVYVSVDDSLHSVLQAVRCQAFGYVLKKGNGIRLLRPVVRQALAHVRALRKNYGLSAQLRRANEELERRVVQRTLELEQTIQELESQKLELRDTVRILEESRERALMQDRLATLGMLAASVAHDINNPAAYILSNLRTAQRNLATLRSELQLGGGSTLVQVEALAEAEAVLEDSMEGIGRILTIARDITPFACPQQSVQDAVDINEASRIACKTVANQIRHRAQLETRLGDVPITAGDQKRFVQALVNLLSNAALAIPEGDSAHNLIVVETAYRDRRLVVRVSDTGCGIPEALLARVQEPFFTTRKPGEGTGLGLALVAQVVAEHRGTLSISSKLGQGTCVTLSFPVDSRAVPTARRSTAAETKLLEGLRLLVIDDDVRLLRALQRELGVRNHVTTALGGQLALKMLLEDPTFDLVICDLMMPDLDGPKLHEALTEHAPDVIGRLVFMTGGAFTDRARDFVSRVPCPVLTKPVSEVALSEAYSRMHSKAVPLGANLH